MGEVVVVVVVVVVARRIVLVNVAGHPRMTSGPAKIWKEAAIAVCPRRDALKNLADAKAK